MVMNLLNELVRYTSVLIFNRSIDRVMLLWEVGFETLLRTMQHEW